MAYKYGDKQREYYRKYNSEHRDEIRGYNIKYRAKHSDEIRERRRKGYAERSDEIRERHRKYRAEHGDEIRERHRKYRSKIRFAILEHYGLSCACCGESTYEFLGIDHVNGGGNKQRAALQAKGNGFYKWLIKNDFPPGFQTLCHNCNMAKGFYGKCPHERTLAVENVSDLTA